VSRRKTDQQIVDGANALAHQFYRMTGYVAPPDVKFWEEERSRERLAWDMAVLAYDHIEKTCVQSAVANLLSEVQS
jgi:hypothetical protein